MGKWGRIAGMVAVLSCVATCSTDRVFPGGEFDRVPADAVGVVSIGALQTAKASAGQALMFAFDAEGRLLGKLEGPGIEGNGVVAVGRDLIAPTHGTAKKITASGYEEIPLPGYAVEAATVDSESGAATLWYRARQEMGFVAIAKDNTVRSGTVEGTYIGTVADCGGRQFVVVEDFIAVDAPRPYTLYEVMPNGQREVRSKFHVPGNLSPRSGVSACAPDGQTIYTMYAGGSYEVQDPNLVLVRTNVNDGSRTQTQLDVNDNVRRGSMTVVGNQLLWLSYNGGEIYSVALEGDSTATEVWRLPGDQKKVSAGVNGTTVSVVNDAGVPTFAQYDLVTGKRTRDPIELPWLEPIVGSAVGNTFYVVSGVAGLK